MNETTNEHETLAGGREAIRLALANAVIGAARDQLEGWARMGGGLAVRIVHDLLAGLDAERDRLRDAQVTIRSLVGAWDPSDPATVVPNPPPGHHWTSFNAQAAGRTSCLVCPTRPQPVSIDGAEPSFSIRPTTATECLTEYRRDLARRPASDGAR